MSNVVARRNRQVEWPTGYQVWHILFSIGLMSGVAPFQISGAVVQEPVHESVSSSPTDALAIDDAATEAIADGISTLKSVRQSLKDDEPFDLGPPTGPTETLQYSPDMMDLLSSELENARQVEELRDRIRKLIEFDRQRILQQLTADPEPATDSKSPAASDSEPNPAANQTTTASVPQGESDTGVDNTNSDSKSVATIDTKRILSQPPDQLALADSLFYSGELELAYDLYRRARTNSSNKIDSVWIDYQTACCLRRLGNTDGAGKILREIAESAGTEPVGANARWWLDQIDQKKLIQEELRTFEQFIKRKENEDVKNQGLPRTGS